MNTLKFGHSDLQVSQLCLGCMTYGEPERGNHPWTLPEVSSRPLIRQALDAGINFLIPLIVIQMAAVKRLSAARCVTMRDVKRWWLPPKSSSQ